VHEAGRNREDPFENSATRILVLRRIRLVELGSRDCGRVVGWLVGCNFVLAG
jgi:hypothetical protein